MCILGNMHGCFYGLWSKNNEYRVTIELVQKNRYIKKKIRKICQNTYHNTKT